MARERQSVTLWLTLNEWALLLDVAALVSAVVSAVCFCRGRAILGIASLSAFLLAGRGAILVHSSYDRKLRLYGYLLRKNHNRLRVETFRHYLDAPCHRTVCRAVLRRLGAGHGMYREVMRRYYRYPWQRLYDFGTEPIFFKNKEEGEKWLSQRQESTT